MTQGDHGPILTQFKGKLSEALTELRRLKTGEARAVLHHDEVGHIDIIWGKAGDPAKKYAGGYGLAHIDAKHPGVADDLQKILDTTKINWKKSQEGRLQLEDNDHVVKVRLDWELEDKNWILTAFEKI